MEQRRVRYSLPLKAASRLALMPAASVTLVCFYVFIGWTFVISLTGSRLLPAYAFIGFEQYRRLCADAHWWTAMGNLGVYAVCFISGCILLGYLLAILIERAVHLQAVYCTLFMLPLSISFVVTGVVWQWLLNPALGIQQAVRDAGWETFTFNWLVRQDRAIYTIVIAAIWQQAGMCMALFLAGLRAIDPGIWKIAAVDAIPAWRVYLHVVTPMLRPVFFAATVLLFSMSVKSFDLVVTLTGGGPGFSSDLPARFVVELINRQELGMGSAAACILLGTIAASAAPYVYREVRRKAAGR